MKKSTLNVITLALVLINLALTAVLTFSLVTTNSKTNNLISKVSEIIDLDVAGVPTSDTSTVTLDDISYVTVTNNDSADITISYSDNGKMHYVVLNVAIGMNTKASDYTAKSESVTNAMTLIVSDITTEALKYSYNSVTSNKELIQSNLLTYLQDQFQTTAIYSVELTKIVAQ